MGQLGGAFGFVGGILGSMAVYYNKHVMLADMQELDTEDPRREDRSQSRQDVYHRMDEDGIRERQISLT